MENKLHKRIRIFSLVAVIISVAGTVVGLLFNFNLNEILAVTGLLPVFSFISIITSYAIIYQEKNWIRKATKYTLVICPVCLIASVAALILLNNTSTLLIVIVVLTISVLILLLLIHGFIFSDAVALKWSIAFILMITFAIILKRFHLPLAGFLLTLSLSLFGIGSYIYGIRCMFLAEKVTFLKYVSFFGSCIISVSFFGLLYKLQHWPGGDVLVKIGNISLVIGTLIVLLTLSSSGIISWEPFHKKILKRLLLPWIFIFSLFIIRFLLPELDRIIWKPDRVVVAPYGFEMSDYDIENKNGL
ncbi:MAG: hypothetical protein NTV31_05720 [Bacteroidia bacterium]|nr:hypothetical protein [Bacteroidia bacterium]